MTSQSTLTEKRTVITSHIGGGSSSANTSLSAMDGDEDFYYKSSIHPRHASMGHSGVSTVVGSPGGGSNSYKRTVEISSGMLPSGYGNVSHTGVNNVKHTREREKKDMQDLNERFANYIEKVRFLEAQNRKLGSELEQLKSHWGKETSAIKKMYETELEEARSVIEETNKEKNKLEVKMQTMQDQLNNALRQLEEAKKWRSQDRETINKLNQQLSELEGEIRMLRRTNDSLDAERLRDKQTIARLQEELEKLRVDLSNETIARLDAENKYQTLLEEIEFLKSVHEQELKELSALAYRDTTAENREFWKNELSQAIRDIQQEYDIKVDQIRGEMETFYNLKVQEFRTGATKQNMEVTHAREEVKKLQKILSDSRGRLADLEARNAQLEKQYQDLLRELEQKEHDHLLETNSLKEEMNKLRAEMEGMLVELQTLMDAKLSLELEIAAYRKLLEHEESRIPLRSSLRRYNSTFSTSGGSRPSQTGPSGTSSPPPVAPFAAASSPSSATPQAKDSGNSRPGPSTSLPTVRATEPALETRKVYSNESGLENYKENPVEVTDSEIIVRSSTPAVQADPTTSSQKTSVKAVEGREDGEDTVVSGTGVLETSPVSVKEPKKAFGEAEGVKIRIDNDTYGLGFGKDGHSENLTKNEAETSEISCRKEINGDKSIDHPVKGKSDNLEGGDVKPVEVSETIVPTRSKDVHASAVAEKCTPSEDSEKGDVVAESGKERHKTELKSGNTFTDSDMENASRGNSKFTGECGNVTTNLPQEKISDPQLMDNLEDKECDAKVVKESASVSQERESDNVDEISSNFDDVIQRPSVADTGVHETSRYSGPVASIATEKNVVSIGETSDDDSLCIQTMAEYNEDDEDIINEGAGEALADSAADSFVKSSSETKTYQSDGLKNSDTKDGVSESVRVDNQDEVSKKATLESSDVTFAEIHSSAEDSGKEFSKVGQLSEKDGVLVSSTKDEPTDQKETDISKSPAYQSRLGTDKLSEEGDHDHREANSDVCVIHVNIKEGEGLVAEAVHKDSGHNVRPPDNEISQDNASDSQNKERIEKDLSFHGDANSSGPADEKTKDDVTQSENDVIIAKTFVASESSAAYFTEPVNGEERSSRDSYEFTERKAAYSEDEERDQVVPSIQANINVQRTEDSKATLKEGIEYSKDTSLTETAYDKSGENDERKIHEQDVEAIEPQSDYDSKQYNQDSGIDNDSKLARTKFDPDPSVGNDPSHDSDFIVDDDLKPIHDLKVESVATLDNTEEPSQKIEAFSRLEATLVSAKDEADYMTIGTTGSGIDKEQSDFPKDENATLQEVRDRTGVKENLTEASPLEQGIACLGPGSGKVIDDTADDVLSKVVDDDDLVDSHAHKREESSVVGNQMNEAKPGGEDYSQDFEKVSQYVKEIVDSNRDTTPQQSNSDEIRIPNVGEHTQTHISEIERSKVVDASPNEQELTSEKERHQSVDELPKKQEDTLEKERLALVDESPKTQEDTSEKETSKLVGGALKKQEDTTETETSRFVEGSPNKQEHSSEIEGSSLRDEFPNEKGDSHQPPKDTQFSVSMVQSKISQDIHKTESSVSSTVSANQDVMENINQTNSEQSSSASTLAYSDASKTTASYQNEQSHTSQEASSLTRANAADLNEHSGAESQVPTVTKVKAGDLNEKSSADREASSPSKINAGGSDELIYKSQEASTVAKANAIGNLNDHCSTDRETSSDTKISTVGLDEHSPTSQEMSSVSKANAGDLDEHSNISQTMSSVSKANAGDLDEHSNISQTMSSVSKANAGDLDEHSNISQTMSSVSKVNAGDQYEHSNTSQEMSSASKANTGDLNEHRHTNQEISSVSKANTGDLNEHRHTSQAMSSETKASAGYLEEDSYKDRQAPSVNAGGINEHSSADSEALAVANVNAGDTRERIATLQEAYTVSKVKAGDTDEHIYTHHEALSVNKANAGDLDNQSSTDQEESSVSKPLADDLDKRDMTNQEMFTESGEVTESGGITHAMSSSQEWTTKPHANHSVVTQSIEKTVETEAAATASDGSQSDKSQAGFAVSEERHQQSIIPSLASSPGRFEAVRTKTVAETVSGEGPVYVTTYQESHSARHSVHPDRVVAADATDDMHVISFGRGPPSLETMTLRHDVERVGLRSVVEQTLGVRQSGAGRLADLINVSEEQSYEAGGDSQISMKMMRGEVSAKTTYQRTANGPVSIAEANPEGKFIMLENNPSGGIRKEMNLDGWKIRRVVDNNKRGAHEYTFRNYSLKPNKAVKIYARAMASQAGPNDLVFREADNWGAGSEVVTTLINDKGEEKASHIQKTNYHQ